VCCASTNIGHTAQRYTCFPHDHLMRQALQICVKQARPQQMTTGQASHSQVTHTRQPKAVGQKVGHAAG
jgi:hypothetical protein